MLLANVPLTTRTMHARESTRGALNANHGRETGAISYNQHQFGGTIGGPFLKKNGYFFFSYEGWREVLPDGIVTTVPTADMYPDASDNVNLSGYLKAVHKTGIYDPQTITCAAPTSSGGCNTYTRSLFPNNTIPAARLSPPVSM